jgi:transcriptional regulator with XRE-family HTH domain
MFADYVGERSMPEKELAEIIGRAIALRRRAAGMTQEELADILGIAPDTLSRMENGRFAPKIGRMRDIAAALRCSVTDLFRESDEKTADRASTIAEILKPLPDEAQAALVELMRQAARVMRS